MTLLMMTRQCLKIHLVFIILMFWIISPFPIFAQTDSTSVTEAGQTLSPKSDSVDLNYREYNLFADKVYRKRISSIRNLSGLKVDTKNRQAIDELQVVNSKFISDNSRMLGQIHPKPRELLILKGEVQQHEASAKKIEKLIKRDIEQLSGWQNEWITLHEELGQWQDHHSQGYLSAISPDRFAELQQEVDTGRQNVKIKIRSLLEQSRMVREINTSLFKLAYDVDELLKQDLFSTPKQTSIPLFTFDFLQQFDTSLWQDTVASLAGFVQLEFQNKRESYFVVFLVLLATVAFGIFLQRTARKLVTYPELAVFRGKAFASAFFLTTLGTWYFSILHYSTSPQIYPLIVFVLMLAAAQLVRFLFESSFTSLFLKRSILFLALTTFLQMVNPPKPVTRVFLFCAIVIGMGYSYFLAYKSTMQKAS